MRLKHKLLLLKTILATRVCSTRAQSSTCNIQQTIYNIYMNMYKMCICDTPPTITQFVVNSYNIHKSLTKHASARPHRYISRNAANILADIISSLCVVP